MSGQHEWVNDVERSMDMNAKCAPTPFDIQFSIDRCSTCGCIRITDYYKMMNGKLDELHVYKPMEWTWNPFKVLKKEPPCPAHW